MPVAAQTRRLASPAVQTLIRRRLSQLGAIGLAAAGVTLLVALVTYDTHDPSLNTATAQRAHNLAGPPGALIADLLVQGFGLAGVLPGFALLAWAWRIGLHRDGGGFPLRLAALLASLPVAGVRGAFWWPAAPWRPDARCWAPMAASRCGCSVPRSRWRWFCWRLA
jgi:S-DNA-T family DNA segregation ATPase FtsK/SpoIIIE